MNLAALNVEHFQLMQLTCELHPGNPAVPYLSESRSQTFNNSEAVATTRPGPQFAILSTQRAIGQRTHIESIYAAYPRFEIECANSQGAPDEGEDIPKSTASPHIANYRSQYRRRKFAQVNQLSGILNVWVGILHLE